MNKYFYKYTHFREEFFENLMLRATPFKELNDPFEGIFNDKQFMDVNNNLDKFYTEQGHNSLKSEKYDFDGVMDVMQSDLEDVGVLSFTEDFTNPLMWSYYADQHRGLVLEFDSDKPLFQDSIKTLGEQKSRFGKSSLGNCYEFPEKVMYRREMPSFERLELSVPKSNTEYAWIRFYYTLFFTKSNDWIYEKELRSIVQLCEADSVICKNDKHILDELSKDETIHFKELDNERIQIIYPNEYEMHENMGDESIKNEIFMHTKYQSSNIHLFRINPQAISSVYLGYRCNYEKVKKIIEENKQLTHLKNNLYKMVIDRYQYQLKTEKL